MTEAMLWGLVAGLSFVVGGAIASRFRIDRGRLGVVIGLGAGALISAVAYELVDEAGEVAGGSGLVAAGLLTGALRSTAVLRGLPPPRGRLGARRVAAHAIEVVPEAIVIVGTLLLGHGIGTAVIAAVFLCGVPEAMASTTDLLEEGVEPRRITAMWVGLMALCGVSALIGFAVLDGASEGVVAFTLAAAGGAILNGLMTGIVPTAYEWAGVGVGPAAVAGFAVSFALVAVG